MLSKHGWKTYKVLQTRLYEASTVNKGQIMVVHYNSTVQSLNHSNVTMK